MYSMKKQCPGRIRPGWPKVKFEAGAGISVEMPANPPIMVRCRNPAFLIGGH
jgi:hypothetical protein